MKVCTLRAPWCNRREGRAPPEPFACVPGTGTPLAALFAAVHPTIAQQHQAPSYQSSSWLRGKLLLSACRRSFLLIPLIFFASGRSSVRFPVPRRGSRSKGQRCLPPCLASSCRRPKRLLQTTGAERWGLSSCQPSAVEDGVCSSSHPSPSPPCPRMGTGVRTSIVARRIVCLPSCATRRAMTQLIKLAV